ncbi:MAG TPA: hypothetical protein PLG04_00395 [Anaerolineaceae bacterium]|nr:hypothetical protein [Anaerolineaceae bacterium]
MREVRISEADKEAAKQIGRTMNSMSVSAEGVAQEIYNNEHPTIVQSIMRVNMALIWKLAEAPYFDDRSAESVKVAKAIKKALVEQGLGTANFPPALPFI